MPKSSNDNIRGLMKTSIIKTIPNQVKKSNKNPRINIRISQHKTMEYKPEH
ncbi:hypothetical protein J5U22_01715 [Saccharolobus shibatae]|uniref:Uncharacterized protein n=1 Tax=Saccharolobus shibatae TaxID=2286 RepID=A0A8F5BVD8_9CREN|nr:hypothetical protein J5U21_01808 [Saccharolobus shibatae]QXJ35168.1 hypothetical protein J5U22_01715 [Saccharolobus shibatae]